MLMNTTIDSNGRVVVPQQMLDALGLVPGKTVDLEIVDGSMVIFPAPTTVTIDKSSPIAVARAADCVEVLTEQEVLDTLHNVRR